MYLLLNIARNWGTVLLLGSINWKSKTSIRSCRVLSNFLLNVISAISVQLQTKNKQCRQFTPQDDSLLLANGSSSALTISWLGEAFAWAQGGRGREGVVRVMGWGKAACSTLVEIAIRSPSNFLILFIKFAWGFLLSRALNEFASVSSLSIRPHKCLKWSSTNNWREANWALRSWFWFGCCCCCLFCGGKCCCCCCLECGGCLLARLDRTLLSFKEGNCSSTTAA